MLHDAKKYKGDQVSVARTYIPSYSGGRDQEDSGKRPAQFPRPYLEKKPSLQRADGVTPALRAPAWQAWSPEFKPQCYPPPNI
jgi:hypothetical protein